MMIPLGGVLLLRHVMMQGPGDFRESDLALDLVF